MPGILDRISAALGGSTRTRALARTEERFSVDQWVSDFLVPFTYNGVNYVSGGGSYAQQRLGDTVAEITNTLPAYAAALRSAPPAFAAELVRSMILSQARFVFRNRQNSSSPRRTFGTRALSILEEPDPSRKLTTAKMLGIAEWHAGVAGNAFVYRQAGRRPGDRPVLRNLRPDWTAVIWGSQAEPDRAASALDNELLGYVYWNGGYGNGSPWTILPSECAHWAPIPDPENPGLGQSWVTPALREMQGDRAATEHKLTFFRNGATPSLLVKGIAGPNGQPLTKPQFDEVVDMMEARHSGSTNAYKTLYLTGGADATVIGTDLKQVDFTAVQGRGETRVAFLSRVPASLLGISEGMQGSALNAGNFGMARRIFADSWVYPTLQDLAGALSAIVDVPSDAELWFDVSDMPILREDSKDQAEIQQIQAGAISSLINAGYEPDSVVRCVQMGDLSQLKHTGLYSVQLQPPQPGQIGAPGEAAPELPPPVDGGETVPPEDRGIALIGDARSSLERSRRRTRRGGQRPVAAIGPASVREPDALSGQQWRDAIRAITAADRPDDEPIGELDEHSLALLQALDELSGEERARKFNPAEHPRNPKGAPGGGRFRSLVERLKDALTEHGKGDGKGDPLAGFNREQLRKVAKSRGIELKRGEHEDSIKKKLLDDLDESVSKNPRVQALADKQQQAGMKAAGVGVKEPSVAKKKRREEIEAQTNAALDELDAKDAAGSANSAPQFMMPPGVDEEAVVALRERFTVEDPAMASSRLFARQVSSPDPKLKKLIDRVGPVVATRLAWEGDNDAAMRRLVQLQRPDDPTLDEYDDLPPVTDDEIRQIRAAAAEQLARDFKGKKVAVRTTPGALERILSDGRFKTQFETGRSGGGFNTERRADFEEMAFGLPRDADPRQRPTYGYLAMDGVDTRDEDSLLDTYGDVRIVLKDTVRRRTTASVGDTLDRQVLPSPVDAPTWESFNAGAHWSDGMELDYRRASPILYVEAQIHGGVDASDIEEVVFTSKPAAKTVSALVERGIPWRVLGASS